jgi:hypothetical protein
VKKIVGKMNCLVGILTALVGKTIILVRKKRF